MKKTGWYSGDQKPVRIGLYQVLSTESKGAPGYKFWDGIAWSLLCWSKEDAMTFRAYRSGFQESTWRGLTKEAK